MLLVALMIVKVRVVFNTLLFLILLPVILYNLLAYIYKSVLNSVIDLVESSLFN
jgi:hypothetical protein